MVERQALALDKEHLRDLVAEVIDVDVAEVTDHAHFIGDLGVDSLMALEIVIRLDKEYGVNLEEEMGDVIDLQSTYDLLTAKLDGRS
jgi:acyl carrier protein